MAALRETKEEAGLLQEQLNIYEDCHETLSYEVGLTCEVEGIAHMLESYHPESKVNQRRLIKYNNKNLSLLIL